MLFYIWDGRIYVCVTLYTLRSNTLFYSSTHNSTYGFKSQRDKLLTTCNEEKILNFSLILIPSLSTPIIG